MIIKQLPEDFIVKEISNVELSDKGAFSIHLLKKKDYTTEKAVQSIADRLGIKRKFIGYAGNKDRKAVTEQLISIRTTKKVNIQLKDIGLELLGYSDKPISIGDLIGNEFIITARGLSDKDIKKLESKIKNKKIFAPNYFGEQRFSKDNVEIGRLIVKRDFKKAVELILKNNKNNKNLESSIESHLSKNDYIGALRLIPKKILKLYIHSLQSYIFNLTVEEIINKKIINSNRKIPIIGFGSEIEDSKAGKIVSNILKKEDIQPRDFIIRKIPELSADGYERDLYMAVNDLRILESSDDELNKGKKKIEMTFKLDKGCYATVAVRYLFS